jgi:hypothetical protein
MTRSPSASLSPFSVFRNRNFSLMWTGQLISTMGSALTSLAASIYVFRLTGSALSVGLMLMATAAPSLFVGLFAGVFVDRYDRRQIMVIADILRALLILAIPFLVQFNVIWLYIVVMLTSAIGQFFDPAFESVLPEVASDEELAAGRQLFDGNQFVRFDCGRFRRRRVDRLGGKYQLGILSGRGLIFVVRSLYFAHSHQTDPSRRRYKRCGGPQESARRGQPTFQHTDFAFAVFRAGYHSDFVRFIKFAAVAIRVKSIESKRIPIWIAGGTHLNWLRGREPVDGKSV